MKSGLALKRDGQTLVESHNAAFATTMRAIAEKIATDMGTVTIDDLREYAQAYGIIPMHPNAWGAIFRGLQWKCIGFVQSRVPSNHARVIRNWTLVK